MILSSFSLKFSFSFFPFQLVSYFIHSLFLSLFFKLSFLHLHFIDIFYIFCFLSLYSILLVYIYIYNILYIYKVLLPLQFWDLVSSNRPKYIQDQVDHPVLPTWEIIFSLFSFFSFSFLIWSLTSLGVSSVYFAWVVFDIFYFVLFFIHFSLG